ncbi:hypothetical protein ROHU_031581 [Labeo rohita]|uniref:Uncharacterized protein n=1 Tax=Labeo rohita TaxID=84645 RepID=A0A498LPX2_LABRO|nr:hypothetical protein ROHU_031581 [Labeo rohita]
MYTEPRTCGAVFLHSADEDAESVFRSSSHAEAQLTIVTPDDRQAHDLTCRQTYAQCSVLSAFVVHSESLHLPHLSRPPSGGLNLIRDAELIPERQISQLTASQTETAIDQSKRQMPQIFKIE